LPALLKSAIKRDYLGFQIVPGLASSTSEQIALIDHESPRTIYLTDHDSSGLEIHKKIRKAGIDSNRLLLLPSPNSEVTVIEDLVKKESYLNAEIRRSHGDEFRISDSDLGDSNRPRGVENWCKSKNIRSPNKRAVAYRILENQYDFPLLDEAQITLMQELFEKIRSTLNIDSPSN
jgi:predicted ATP-dependent endonuclease of OLD family